MACVEKRQFLEALDYSPEKYKGYKPCPQIKIQGTSLWII
jgi:hypothetical protein